MKNKTLRDLGYEEHTTYNNDGKLCSVRYEKGCNHIMISVGETAMSTMYIVTDYIHRNDADAVVATMRDIRARLMGYDKPPLGVMPKYIRDMDRIKELSRAINEYVNFYEDDINKVKSLLLDWTRELDNLIFDYEERTNI